MPDCKNFLKRRGRIILGAAPPRRIRVPGVRLAPASIFLKFRSKNKARHYKEKGDIGRKKRGKFDIKLINGS